MKRTRVLAALVAAISTAGLSADVVDAASDTTPPTITGATVQFDPSTRFDAGPAMGLLYSVSATDEPGGSGVCQARPALNAPVRVVRDQVVHWRAVAGDCVNNWTGEAQPAFVARSRQEASVDIQYTGTWAGTRGSQYDGGAEWSTWEHGASATFTCTCKAVAWMAPTELHTAPVDVYVDGTYVRTTAQQSRDPIFQTYAVFTTAWATDGVHTVRIVDEGSLPHARMDVDSFWFLR